MRAAWFLCSKNYASHGTLPNVSMRRLGRGALFFAFICLHHCLLDEQLYRAEGAAASFPSLFIIRNSDSGRSLCLSFPCKQAHPQRRPSASACGHSFIRAAQPSGCPLAREGLRRTEGSLLLKSVVPLSDLHKASMRFGLRRFRSGSAESPHSSALMPFLGPYEAQGPPGAAPKVLFVIGPTGVGKSRLAFDLCLALEEQGIAAEIVSADSMQVYKGCNIATAKATPAERLRITHHLLDVCAPQETFSAAAYVRLARDTIDALTRDGKLPVVVGGTQLYIELLLWESAVDFYTMQQQQSAASSLASRTVDLAATRSPEATCSLEANSLDKLGDKELLELLTKLDSKRAKQLHPKDRRRIIRSIEVALLHGVPHSELMEKHCSSKMRYDACVLWLDLRDRASLERRLRKRLSQMCSDGLMKEVEWLAGELQLRARPAGGPSVSGAAHQGSASEPDSGGLSNTIKRNFSVSRGGVLQGIGYKEFLPLVLPGCSVEDGKVLSALPGAPAPTLAACIDLVVLRSMQYARQQRKWIKNKFLVRRRNVPLYYLETTDSAVTAWEEKICGPALRIVEGFLAGRPFSEEHDFAAVKQLPETLKLRVGPPTGITQE